MLHPIKKLVYPLITLLLVVAAWYLAVLAFHVPQYLLPLPQQVASRIYTDFGYLTNQSLMTLGEAVGGFAASVLIGIPLAAILVASPFLDKAVTPWLVLSQTFPKVALAPLIVVWFGLGFVPKVAVTFLVAFFPVVISTMVGLRSMESEMLELARSMRCSRTQLFLHFQFPLALPAMFSGLKVSVAFSIVGAVIAEWVGATKGLGYLLLSANANLDTSLLFAVLVYLTVIGIVMYYGVEAVERLAIPWHVSVRLKTPEN